MQGTPLLLHLFIDVIIILCHESKLELMLLDFFFVNRKAEGTVKHKHKKQRQDEEGVSHDEYL